MSRTPVSVVVVYDNKEYVDRLLSVFDNMNVELQIIRLSPLGSLYYAINDCKATSVIIVGYNNTIENTVSIIQKPHYIRYYKDENIKHVKFKDFAKYPFNFLY